MPLLSLAEIKLASEEVIASDGQEEGTSLKKGERKDKKTDTVGVSLSIWAAREAATSEALPSSRAGSGHWLVRKEAMSAVCSITGHSNWGLY